MPGESDVRMPCRRARYCGSTTCPKAQVCAALQQELDAQAARGGRGWRAQEERRQKEGSATGMCGQPAGASAGAAVAAQPEKPPLARPADTVYLYDGSQEGFYTCVHESVYTHTLPQAIWPEHAAEPSLYDVRVIETDAEKAAKVEKSIATKISPRAYELVRGVWLSCMEEKEIAILRFLLLGYRQGSRTPWMFAHPQVKPLLDAEKHMMGETHLLKGFIRFSDYDGVLAATISPKNFVLPFLVKHFVGRYSCENFLIYDKTHNAALVYENKQVRLMPMEGIEFPQASEEEKQYRALWRRFYKTISIEARENPRCRMTHMPKRYWENMTEMQEYL